MEACPSICALGGIPEPLSPTHSPHFTDEDATAGERKGLAGRTRVVSSKARIPRQIIQPSLTSSETLLGRDGICGHAMAKATPAQPTGPSVGLRSPKGRKSHRVILAKLSEVPES